MERNICIVKAAGLLKHTVAVFMVKPIKRGTPWALYWSRTRVLPVARGGGRLCGTHRSGWLGFGASRRDTAVTLAQSCRWGLHSWQKHVALTRAEPQRGKYQTVCSRDITAFWKAYGLTVRWSTGRNLTVITITNVTMSISLSCFMGNIQRLAIWQNINLTMFFDVFDFMMIDVLLISVCKLN